MDLIKPVGDFKIRDKVVTKLKSSDLQRAALPSIGSLLPKIQKKKKKNWSALSCLFILFLPFCVKMDLCHVLFVHLDVAL